MQDSIIIMASFLVVILCVFMLGSSLLFVVNSPFSASFGYHGVFGPFYWPLMTVFEFNRRVDAGAVHRRLCLYSTTWPGRR